MSDIQPDTGDTITPVVTTTVDLPHDKPDTGDQAAEVEKWKAQARKHEDRAKANADAAKELEKLKAATMSDQEKAVAVARSEATVETLRKVGSRLVDAEVKTAAAGRSVDIEAVLEGLDRSRFLDDDGEPKVDEIVAWVDRIAPPGDPVRQFPDLGQGVRPVTSPHTSPGSAQLERDLKAALGIR